MIIFPFFCFFNVYDVLSNKQCLNIDVVWTWVNDNDSIFLQKIHQFQSSFHLKHFRNYNTLKFSIRSVFQYAPFIHNYYLITDNQIPNFIQKYNYTDSNGNFYSLKIIPHETLFLSGSKYYPIFNAVAIETYLHQIPGIGDCILYMNDDMFLGKPISKNFFLSEKSKIYYLC